MNITSPYGQISFRQTAKIYSSIWPKCATPIDPFVNVLAESNFHPLFLRFRLPEGPKSYFKGWFLRLDRVVISWCDG